VRTRSTTPASIVGSSTLTGEAETHAFVYENGAMRDLGTLGGTYSSAAAVNSQGIVVGKSTDASGRTVAFIYDAGGMRPLLNMPGAQSAVGISDRGAVVGLHRRRSVSLTIAAPSRASISSRK
jgi:probable HAF family extracellular repeat protein